MPSSDEVSNFQDLIAQLAAVAVARTADLMQSSDDEAFLLDAYPVILDPFIAGAGQVAAEWYRSLAPDKEFAVETAPPPAREALNANLRWALTQLDPVKALTGSAERQVFNGSRDTLLSNASRENVRYARYASANACKFCQVLATKTDNFYESKQSAVRVVGRSGRPRGSREIGKKYHDFCRCIPVPVRNGFYEPPPWVEKWAEDYKAASKAGDLNDIVNHMRRSQYPDEKDMLNAERRKRYAAKKAAENT